MEIKQLTVSSQASITTGLNGQYDKQVHFCSATADVDGDTTNALSGLHELTNGFIEARIAEVMANGQGKAVQVAERTVSQVNDEVPQVVAKKSQANWTDSAPNTAPAPSPGGAIQVSDLAVGDFPKKTVLAAKVSKVWPAGERGPPFGKSVLTSGGTELEVAHFDGEPEWSEGDNVTIENAFKVDEYNGKLQLKAGKYAKINVTASAPPTTVDAWQ